MPGNEYAVFSEIPVSVRDKWIPILVLHYNESHRHYHTLNHIHYMLHQLEQISPIVNLSDQQLKILQFAIWFHDVIYTIPSPMGENEVNSVLAFQHYAQDANLVFLLSVKLT